MEYQPIHNSPLTVSRVALGCMSLKPGNPENESILHQALEGGINFFDTADLYDKGANESLLGKTLKPFRSRIVLATKVGNQWNPEGDSWSWNPSKAYILKAVENSLQRLQTDYIDLYQLHGGTLDDPIEESIEAFEILKQQGKIRAYGISSIRPNVIRKWISQSQLSSLMVQYSLLDRRPEEEILNKTKEHAISVITRGSVAQGLLAGKPPKPYLGYEIAEVMKMAEAVKQLSGSKRSPAQTALRFVLHHSAVTSAVVGASNTQQLQESLEVFESPALEEKEYNLLQRITAPNVYAEHR